MSDFLAWVETQADASSAFVLEITDVLERQATTLLNVVLVGAGGSLAYTVNLAERASYAWMKWGMAAVSAWLFIVAGLILLKCLWARDVYGACNDPKNLLSVDGYSLEDIKRFELEHKQKRMDLNRARNHEVSRWLNIARALVVATPIFFTIGAALADL